MHFPSSRDTLLIVVIVVFLTEASSRTGASERRSEDERRPCPVEESRAYCAIIIVRWWLEGKLLRGFSLQEKSRHILEYTTFWEVGGRVVRRLCVRA